MQRHLLDRLPSNKCRCERIPLKVDTKTSWARQLHTRFRLENVKRIAKRSRRLEHRGSVLVSALFFDTPVLLIGPVMSTAFCSRKNYCTKNSARPERNVSFWFCFQSNIVFSIFDDRRILYRVIYLSTVFSLLSHLTFLRCRISSCAPGVSYLSQMRVRCNRTIWTFENCQRRMDRNIFCKRN